MIGRKLSHYRILRTLGHGGMGDVYLAEDERLGRKVAIKTLPPEVAEDPIRRKRFERESRVLAALNHPTIVTIHDVADVDGVSFLVMEWIDGVSLGARIGFEGMSLEEVFELFLPVVDAVAAAHREGIVHRDLKPDNVMIRKDGLIKVVDFGLSKLEAQTAVGGFPVDQTETLTREGAVVGTVHYMAPEALEGRGVDARSDVFSLGVILYEMVAGEKPFHGESALSVITSILRDRPPTLAELRQPLPGGLDGVVSRCLEKDPSRRFSDAGELAEAVRALSEEPIVAAEPAERRARRRIWLAAALAFLVTTIVLGTLWVKGAGVPAAGEQAEASSPAATPPRAPRSAETPIAVLPMRSGESQDLDALGTGVTEALTSHLSRLSRLRVISGPSVRRTATGDGTFSDVARALGARYLVDGHLSREGESLVLSLSLVDPARGSTLWGDTFVGPSRELFDFLAEVAPPIGLAAGAEVEARDTVSSMAPGSFSDRTSEEYLRGLRELASRDPASLQRALAHFQRAARESPEFAPAWAGVASASAMLASFGAGVVPPEEQLEEARIAAERALELRPDLADAHAALALSRFQAWESEGVEPEFRRAIALNPSHSQARVNYSALLVAQGRFQEALVQARTILDLDPLNPISHQVAAAIHYFAGDHEKAVEVADAGIEQVGDFWLLHLTAGDALSFLGRHGEAAARLGKARELSRGHVSTLAALALNASREGDHATAERLREELLQRAAVGFVPPSLVAKAHLAVGDEAAAFDWLERGFRDRDPLMAYLAVDPDYGGIRGDSRFRELVERIGILR